MPTFSQQFTALKNQALTPAETKMITEHENQVEQIYKKRGIDNWLDSDINTLMHEPMDVIQLIAKFDADILVVDKSVRSNVFFTLYMTYDALRALKNNKAEYATTLSALDSGLVAEHSVKVSVLSEEIGRSLPVIRELMALNQKTTQKLQELMSSATRWTALSTYSASSEYKTFSKKFSKYKSATMPVPIPIDADKAFNIFAVCKISLIQSVTCVQNGFNNSEKTLKKIVTERLSYTSEQAEAMFSVVAANDGSYICKVTLNDVTGSAKNIDKTIARTQAAFNALLKMEKHANYFRYFCLAPFEAKPEPGPVNLPALMNFVKEYGAYKVGDEVVTCPEKVNDISCFHIKVNNEHVVLVGNNDPHLIFDNNRVSAREAAAGQVIEYLKKASTMITFDAAIQLRTQYESAVQNAPAVIQPKVAAAQKELESAKNAYPLNELKPQNQSLEGVRATYQAAVKAVEMLKVAQEFIATSIADESKLERDLAALSVQQPVIAIAVASSSGSPSVFPGLFAADGQPPSSVLGQQEIVQSIRAPTLNHSAD